MRTSTTTLSAGGTQAPRAGRPARPADRGHLGRITVLSLGIGVVTALILTFVAFPGAAEPVITGAGLVGFASGWALLATLSARLTTEPQRWAWVPATVMGTTGVALILVAPDDGALTAAGWVWAPAMLTVAVWSAVHAIRSLDTRARSWVVLPALALLALVAVGGGYQTLRVTLDSAAYSMPGRSVDIGEYALHLDCTGTGSPTVVLESGLGGTSTLWSRITAEISSTTRVCAYDHAGQGWSESADSPRDAAAVAADLHALLDQAGEAGPFVVVGHSVGGLYAMTFAAEHPSEVAGMVLLDSTSPYDIDASLAGRSGGGSGPMMFLPSLARMGLAQLMPTSGWSSLPAPAAGAYRASVATARGATNTVDELAEYPAVFAQAQALTTLGRRPLVVLTLADKERTDAAGHAAQERFAELSTNSSLRTADTTHVGLLDDQHGAPQSVRAITDAVESVRTGTAVPRS